MWVWVAELLRRNALDLLGNYISQKTADRSLSQLRWSSICFIMAPSGHTIAWTLWINNQKTRWMRVKDWRNDMFPCGVFGVHRPTSESDENCTPCHAQILPMISGETASLPWSVALGLRSPALCEGSRELIPRVMTLQCWVLIWGVAIGKKSVKANSWNHVHWSQLPVTRVAVGEQGFGSVLLPKSQVEL